MAQNAKPRSRQCHPSCHKQRGAALLLVLLIVMMSGLAFFFKSANQGVGNYARERGTEEALAQAKAVLIGYAATYRDTHANQVFGYLPCPDIDNDGVAELVCGATDTTMIGRLPYKSLGLPDLRATGGECLWYMVSGSHKYNPKTAQLNWDARGQIRVQDSSGTALIDPSDTSGGAVAVIIAPGSPLAGQNRPAGATNCSGDASNSIASYLDGGYAAATTGTLAVVAGQPGSNVNNDRVAWISARELFAPITKRTDLLGTLLIQLTSCLNLTGAQHIPTINKSAAGPSKWVSDSVGIDEVRAILGTPTCDVLDDISFPLKAAWRNWKDHFRYVICDPSSSNCIQVNAANCSGALLFGGKMANVNPRTAAEKLVLANYFDPANVTTLTTAASAFNGITVYDGKTPASDIVICLQPAPP